VFAARLLLLNSASLEVKREFSKSIVKYSMKYFTKTMVTGIYKKVKHFHLQTHHHYPPASNLLKFDLFNRF
jgi:hypothetical protein